jgi:hypothetical protein
MISQLSIACVFSLTLSACGLNRPQAPPPLARTIGSWQLKSLEPQPIAEAPELARTRIHSWWKAEYAGSGIGRVNVYELTTAVGLDLVQKWKPAPDSVTFDTDRYFIVVSWKNADRSAATELVRGLQRSLK